MKGARIQFFEKGNCLTIAGISGFYHNINP
jgi:hypothetical protein